MKREHYNEKAEFWIGLALFVIITSVGAYAVHALTIRFEASAIQTGVQKMVQNVREMPDLPTGSGLTDITTPLLAAHLIPVEVREAGLPIRIALNRATIIPIIEINISKLSKARCNAYLERLTKQARKNGLYAIWVAGPGVMSKDFPVTIPFAGCQGSSIELQLQYRLVPTSY